MLVVLVAVGSIALIARQTTTSELHRLRQGEGEGPSGSSDLGRSLSDYYAETGNWDGVSSVIGEKRGQGRGESGRGGGPPLLLADAGGQVILDTVGDQVGQRLSADTLAQGEPVIVNGDQVGTLLQGSYSAVTLSQADQDFLDRVESALIIGALIAIGVALVIGFIIFRGITAPLRRLTQATTAVAEGDLSVQVPVPSKSGDEIAQLGLAFNQMTADLARADQLRRDMTADIAHELRTPLTVIQGNLEAILDGAYPADTEHLEPVLRKTQLLRRLVADLRTLALADAGELVTVKDFSVHAQAAGVDLTHDIPALFPLISADASRIEQVLGILLDNALRHTPAGGEIQVDLQSVDSETWSSVRDTGEGILSEALPHVFERFYRAKSNQPHPGGSGLGLAIAQAIIAAHGGRIWAESDVGQGTTITFALPSQSS